MARDTLGPFEYQVLSILLRQPRDAYGATLQERIEDATGQDVSIGAIYTTLDRLERKGLVKSRWGEPTAERGGRRKRYYEIDASGREAVYRTEALHARLGARAPLGLGAWRCEPEIELWRKNFARSVKVQRILFCAGEEIGRNGGGIWGSGSVWA
jgi:PadR family transcriptional regulator PadR